jgi:hypothetical protein
MESVGAGMNVVSNRCIRTEHERPHIPPKWNIKSVTCPLSGF